MAVVYKFDYGDQVVNTVTGQHGAIVSCRYDGSYQFDVILHVPEDKVNDSRTVVRMGVDELSIKKKKSSRKRVFVDNYEYAIDDKVIHKYSDTPCTVCTVGYNGCELIYIVVPDEGAALDGSGVLMTKHELISADVKARCKLGY